MKSYRAIAEYYDPEYAGYPWLERDVPFLMKHIGNRLRRVLELATGTARAAIPLAQAGHRVVGVDVAADMLSIARRKRDAVGLDDASLRLVRGDILKLNLAEQFDWVVLMFNTFLTFTTLARQDATLRAVKKHLRPRGRFWIDIFNPDPAQLARPSERGLDPIAFYVPSLDRTVCKTTHIERSAWDQTQDVMFEYRWFDAEGNLHQDNRHFSMTHIFARELELLLGRHGLKLEHLWGDYDGSPVSDVSPRLIGCAVASGSR